MASAVLLGSGDAPTQRGAGGGDYLALQNIVVEERRAAVAAFALEQAAYKEASARAPGAVGINLDAAEAARRDAQLTSLVLECIDAVDGYNFAAQARSAADLRAAGLPENFAWGIDCAAGTAEVSR